MTENTMKRYNISTIDGSFLVSGESWEIDEYGLAITRTDEDGEEIAVAVFAHGFWRAVTEATTQ